MTNGNIKDNKLFKQETINDKRNWYFARFLYGRDYKYRQYNNDSTEHLSSKYPVPECKFDGFAKTK